jgi:hypothetical protein
MNYKVSDASNPVNVTAVILVTVTEARMVHFGHWLGRSSFHWHSCFSGEVKDLARIVTAAGSSLHH